LLSHVTSRNNGTANEPVQENTEVAQASGFGTAEYPATLFKATTGQTPLKYRSQIRGR
jgi:AraC-like DNA-binding protein